MFVKNCESVLDCQSTWLKKQRINKSINTDSSSTERMLVEKNTRYRMIGIILHFNVTHFPYFCCEHQAYHTGWLSSKEMTTHENN